MYQLRIKLLVLNVSAKDKATGKEQQITISNSNLSDEEIERMKADAEAHKEEDQKKEERMKFINQAQMVLNGVTNTFEDEKMKEKLTEQDKENIESVKKPLEDALNDYQKAEDKDEAYKKIEDTYKAFTDIYQPIIEKIYQEVNPQQPQADEQPTSNPFGNFNANGSNPFADGMFNGNNPFNNPVNS